MSRVRLRGLLLALALLDIVVFGAWITREEAGRRFGVEVRLPVEGYDPRDLLSGHYVRFRLVAAREARALDARWEEGLGYCVDVRSDGRAHIERVRRVPSDCALFLTATFDAEHRPQFGVERFYVDERRQDQVGGFSAGDDTYLVARVDGAGRIHPVDLVVKGRSLHGR